MEIGRYDGRGMIAGEFCLIIPAFDVFINFSFVTILHHPCRVVFCSATKSHRHIIADFTSFLPVP